MPTGPSHSHGGGGSFSSGGGSGGGFGVSGGSFGGGTYIGARGPRPVHFFGRTLIIGHFSSVCLVFLIIFLCFSIFFCVHSVGRKGELQSTIAETEQMIKTYEDDAVYYADMIEKAGKEEGYYTANAEFDFVWLDSDDTFHKTGMFEYRYYNGLPYYYVAYSYNNPKMDMDHLKQYGETYTQFTSGELMAMLKDASQSKGEIKIVYHYDEADGKWYSINRDYELEENIEYLLAKQDLENAQSSLSTAHIPAIVAGVMIAVFVVLLVVLFIVIFKRSKKKQEIEDAKATAEIAEAKAREEASKEEIKSRNRICAYCGCAVPDGAKRCPSCGSSKFVKK